MATLIDSVRVGLSLDDSRFARGLAASTAGLKKFAGLATVGALGLGAIVSQGLAANDVLQKTASRTNTTVEALSGLEILGELSDVTLPDLERGLGRITRVLGQAAEGAKGPRKAFADLGLNIDAMLKLKPQVQLGAIADALNLISDPARKSAIAYAILGKNAETLKPLLDGGSKAMQLQADELAHLGLLLSQVGANDSAKALDAMTKLTAVVKRAGQVFAAEAAPEIESFVNGALSIIPPAVDAITTAWRAAIAVGTEVFGVFDAILSMDFSRFAHALAEAPGRVLEAFGGDGNASASVAAPQFSPTPQQRAELGLPAAGDGNGVEASRRHDQRQGEIVEILRHIEGNTVNLNVARAQ